MQMSRRDPPRDFGIAPGMQTRPSFQKWRPGFHQSFIIFGFLAGQSLKDLLDCSVTALGLVSQEACGLTMHLALRAVVHVGNIELVKVTSSGPIWAASGRAEPSWNRWQRHRARRPWRSGDALRHPTVEVA